MKTIALISVTSVNIAEHCAALEHSKRELLRSRPVDRVILFSDKQPVKGFSGEWLKLPHAIDIMSYGRIQVRQLGRIWDQLIRTDFMLNIQADGFITNGSLWKDEFLAYDYIGAPWAKPQKDGLPFDHPDPECFRVGNSGFSLRSQKLMKALSIPWKEVSGEYAPYDDQGDDIYCCQILRPWLENTRGIKFANLELAARFSIEHDIPEFPNRTPENCFGQHGRIRIQST